MMAALHPAETALRQASKAGHNSSQPGSGGKDCTGQCSLLRYLKDEACKNHQAGRSTACQVAVMLVGI